MSNHEDPAPRGCARNGAHDDSPTFLRRWHRDCVGHIPAGRLEGNFLFSSHPSSPYLQVWSKYIDVLDEHCVMGSNNGVPTQQKQDHGKAKERKSEKEKKGKKRKKKPPLCTRSSPYATNYGCCFQSYITNLHTTVITTHGSRKLTTAALWSVGWGIAY